jgi:hypothetical protein
MHKRKPDPRDLHTYGFDKMIAVLKNEKEDTNRNLK